MTRKRPKPRDIREKEQKIRKREEKARSNEYEHFRPRCPKCDSTNMQFFPSPTLGKFFVYCGECYSGDCLDCHAGNQEIDYFHQFKDNFGNACRQQPAGYYFKGKVYLKNLKEFKEEILKELERMAKDHIGQDIVHSSMLRSFAEKTGDSYNFIRAIDDDDIVLEFYNSKRLLKYESLSEEDRATMIGLIFGEIAMRADARKRAQKRASTWKIERGGLFCYDSCLCLKCSEVGKHEQCHCPCSFENRGRTEYCENFSPQD